MHKAIRYRCVRRLAAGAALCFSAQAFAGPVEDLVAGIQSDSIETRIETAMAAGAAGVEGLKAIEPFLTSDNYVVKKAAFQSIDAIVIAAGQPDAEALRAAVTAELLRLSAPEQPLDVRLTAVRKLGLIGKDDAVETLAQRIDDEATAQDAIMALERIPGAAATKALGDALASAAPAAQARIAAALGNRGDKAAIDALKAAAKSSEETVKWAAADALADLAVPPTQVFPLPGDAAPEQVQRYTMAAFRAADALAAEGETAGAEAIYGEILKHSRRADHIAYGLTGLAAIESPLTLRHGLAYLGTPDNHNVAVQALTELTAPETNAKLAQAYGNMRPMQQAAVLGVLAKRGAAETAALAAEAAKSDEPALRLAAAWAADADPAFDDLLAVAEKGPFYLQDPAIDAIFTSGGNDPDMLRRVIDSDMSEDVRRAARFALVTALADRNDADGVLAIGVESDDAELVAAAAAALERIGADPATLAQRKGYITAWTLYGPFENGENAAAGKAPAELLAPAPAAETGAPAQAEQPAAPEGKTATAAAVPAVVDIRQHIARSRTMAALAEAPLTGAGPQKVVLLIGSNDGCEVWLNGEQVHNSPAPRAYAADQDQVRVKLNDGPNTLVVKVFNDDGDWQFSVRVRHEDGTPFDTGK